MSGEPPDSVNTPVMDDCPAREDEAEPDVTLEEEEEEEEKVFSVTSPSVVEELEVRVEDMESKNLAGSRNSSSVIPSVPGARGFPSPLFSRAELTEEEAEEES